MIESTKCTFAGDGLTLVGERWDPSTPGGRNGTVLLLHGGGQTRHSWDGTCRQLVSANWRAIAFDARGHGESDWAPNGDYSHEAIVADATAVARSLDERPILVGASMGGLAALFAQGAEPALARALVLVDVTPRLEAAGVSEITDFMQRGLDGFESLDAASVAIAAHNPYRKRPVRAEGLMKNLRLRDGRWHWHWDPAVLAHAVGRDGEPGTRLFAERAHAVAERVAVPTLLVRGADSRVVSDDGVRELLAVLPSARYVDVAAAGHMVAGDDNDVFAAALLDFINPLGEISAA